MARRSNVYIDPNQIFISKCLEFRFAVPLKKVVENKLNFKSWKFMCQNILSFGKEVYLFSLYIYLSLIILIKET